MAKYSALDIANFYVELANSIPNDSIDNLKLNKLCYYAQGWNLAKNGYPLFDETIEAWRYGPLVPSVYRAFKACGNQPIAEAIAHFDEARLSQEELLLLTDVYITYGKYSSRGLMDKTHEPGTPWSKVFVDMQNNPISQDSLRDYFSQSNELESMELHISPENVLNYA